MSDLGRLSGLGPKRVAALHRSGIQSLRDLVYHIPRSYADRTRFQRIDQMVPGDETYCMVTLHQIDAFQNRLVLKVGDDTGEMELVFFNAVPYLRGKFNTGTRMVVAGTPSFFRTLQIVHPEWSVVGATDPEPEGLLPRYPITETMSEARIEHKLLNKCCLEALAQFEFSDPVVEVLRQVASLTPEREMLITLHHPTSLLEVEKAKREIKLRELLPLFSKLEQKRKLRMHRGRAYPRDPKIEQKFLKGLPFTLTAGQLAACSAIADALALPHQFCGMLQGDVGSGKTVVALFAALGVMAAGGQVAFMAPTEILASQHFNTLSSWLKPLGLETALLTGDLPQNERGLLINALQAGQIKCLVGTHALFSSDVLFQHLGLAIIDEQHRFGVKQRDALVEKGGHPDVLYLSATPIPRTLAQTLYGDLDSFILAEKPAGRLPIKTRLVPNSKLGEMLSFLLSEVKSGNQVYWVVPRIGETGNEEESSGVNTVVQRLRRHSSEWSVGMVHGRLPSPQKELALQQFRKGELQVLVATTVIEVGVDVPGANIMVIEGVDRFGLAQLHQLRGRTGRGSQQAWCFLLLPDTGSFPESEIRLREFAATEDGFKLAEMDMESRGAGNLEGTLQSGFGVLRFTDLIRDKALTQEALRLVRGLEE